MYRIAGKRAIDVLASAVALIVTAPILAAVCGVVLLNLGRPVIFRQMRAGRGGRPFMLYKFRSMRDDRDENGHLLPDERRLNALGRILRSTSVDELPTLVNVLSGDMSLVGPRPLFTQYVERYNQEQRRRLEAKPGITGWAQVNGRNELSWEEKFCMDVWYVDHISFRLDMKIIGMTVWKVLRREGISAPEHATAEPFYGTAE